MTSVNLYVDGACRPNIDAKVVGWGFVIIDDNEQIIFENCGKLTNAKSRNIDGELEAAFQGIQYLVKHNIHKFKIYYDYYGVEKWITREWKAKKDVSKTYVARMMPLLQNTTYEFIHIKSHSKNKWNNYADNLATSVLT